MYKIVRLLPACALLAVSAAASAEESGLNYTFLEGGYVNTDVDDVADGDGFGVAGSFALTDRFFVFGSYSTVELDFDGPFFDDEDYETITAGLGANYPIHENIDLVGELAYVYAELGSFDDSGYGVFGGMRGRVADQFELEGGIQYVDLDDVGDDTSVSGGARWYFTEEFAAGAGISVGDDVTTYAITLRWEIPRP